MITLELDQSIFNNLCILVIEGAKSKATGELGIVTGAQILQILGKAKEAAQMAQPNGSQ